MMKVNIKSKVYKMKGHNVKALDNVNFEINNNGLVCILGPSGSGKTTLMNIVGALDSDFEGDVVINDKSLKKAKNKDLDSYRKNTIGFIFQQFYLLSQFSVYDNVALALTLSNVSDNKSKVMGLLKDVEMEKFSKRKVNVLSGGQKQRVAIARALANNPDIILADEPTGALDSRMGHEIMSTLKDLSKDKLVMVITHSEELASEFADTVIRMEDGKVTDIKIVNKLKEHKNQAKEETKSVMSYAKAFAHSAKSLWQKKGRAIATSLGMSIGIIGIALALALSNGSNQIVRSQVNSIMPTNMLSVYFKEGYSSGITMTNGMDDVKMFSYQDLLDIKKLDKNIEYFWAAPSTIMQEFFSEVTLSEENAKTGKIEDDSLYTMNGPEPFETINGNLTLGKEPNGSSEIVISLTTAEALLTNGEDISTLIGDKLFIKYGPTTSIGREDEKNQVLSFEIVGITSVNTMGYSIYQKVNDTLALYSSLTNIKIEDMKFVEVYAYLNSDLRSNEIRKTIENDNKKQDTFIFVNAAESIIDGVESFMDTVRNVLIGFSSISVVVAILMIGIVIFISVIERIDEIGILRAIGARSKDIRNIFLSESMVIGLLAGSFGVLISLGLCNIINSVIALIIRESGMQLGNLDVAVLDPFVGFILILVCILLALIAGLIPSLKAAKMDPIEALRRK